jgi:hypothetical protein
MRKVATHMGRQADETAIIATLAPAIAFGFADPLMKQLRGTADPRGF